jgi:hypothetical protein
VWSPCGIDRSCRGGCLKIFITWISQLITWTGTWVLGHESRFGWTWTLVRRPRTRTWLKSASTLTRPRDLLDSDLRSATRADLLKQILGFSVYNLFIYKIYWQSNSNSYFVKNIKLDFNCLMSQVGVSSHDLSVLRNVSGLGLWLGLRVARTRIRVWRPRIQTWLKSEGTWTWTGQKPASLHPWLITYIFIILANNLHGWPALIDVHSAFHINKHVFCGHWFILSQHWDFAHLLLFLLEYRLTVCSCYC